MAFCPDNRDYRGEEPMSRKTLVHLFSVIFALSAVASTLQAREDPRMRYLDMGTYEGVPYLSGGIGLDERRFITETLAADYNLKLELAAANGDYISNVEVLILGDAGDVVLRADVQGPWLLARLSPGRYRVEATAEGRTFSKAVKIAAEGSVRLVFREW
jgi:hypothetical protein